MFETIDETFHCDHFVVAIRNLFFSIFYEFGNVGFNHEIKFRKAKE